MVVHPVQRSEVLTCPIIKEDTLSTLAIEGQISLVEFHERFIHSTEAVGLHGVVEL